LGFRVLTKPDKIGRIAEIEIGNVRHVAAFDAAALIPTDPSLEEAHLESVKAEFDKLVPAFRHRGKFAFMFFVHWLNELCAERRKAASVIFQGCAPLTKVRTDHDSKALLAARSPLPIGFSGFVHSIFT
jgi:hypothetical protein